MTSKGPREPWFRNDLGDHILQFSSNRWFSRVAKAGVVQFSVPALTWVLCLMGSTIAPQESDLFFSFLSGLSGDTLAN